MIYYCRRGSGLRDALRARMLADSEGAKGAADALAAIEFAYVRFGAENPAYYRLMFGTTVTAFDETSPAELVKAAAATRAVLGDVIRRGVQGGAFKVRRTMRRRSPQPSLPPGHSSTG